jgi:hypothetical protein
VPDELGRGSVAVRASSRIGNGVAVAEDRVEKTRVWTPCSAAAAAATLTEWPSENRNRAPLSARMKESFSAFVCGFTTRNTPPAMSVPKSAAAHWAVLSR